MISLIDFFLVKHDFTFVALAALVCLISAYAWVGLTRHAARSTGIARNIWTAVAALAVGSGIWATHFVAMLAFRPGFTLHYDVLQTVWSLAIAVIVSGIGIGMAIRGTSTSDRFLGGAVVGVGISTMHYTGISALVHGGEIVWNLPIVAASVLIGMFLGGFAMVFAMGDGWQRRATGMLLLTAAICTMHFSGMAAGDFSRCFPLMANGALDGGLLSGLVAFGSILILAIALGAVVLDEADRRRTLREKARARADEERINEVSTRLELALTHMGQGISLFDADGYLRFHNERVVTLLGLREGISLEGKHLREICYLLVSRATFPDQNAELATDRILAEHLAMIRLPAGGDITHNMPDERILRILHSPVGDGSWVTTLEDITERKRNEEAIAHLAHHDVLTGLPNRALFEMHFGSALTAAKYGDSNLAVIAIDLDGFKEVNDTHGHAAGDAVLQTLADRMRDGLRDGEVLARLGGDEFAALKTFTSMDSLRDFLNRIEGALFTRIRLDDGTVNTGGSIGVAIYPDDGADRSKLLSNADLAMYRAKAEFDRRICFYESEMDEHSRQRRSMAKDIWEALETSAFHLAYQVQKSVATGEVTGYEVLLRWNRRGHGLVSPADFVPIAEEIGAINAIGTWVLKTACFEAASWPEPYKIAVNISGLQLGQIELIETVRSTLFLSGLAPERLELEVTETSIIADRPRALHILRQIKALGVSIAIDDFGTGYSSLETLRAFPFDKIKLDRSFMHEVARDDQSKAIVRAILALGRSLQVPVLAEGVETTEQLELLRVEGCNEAQGFLLGRPGTIEWSDMLEVPQKLSRYAG